MRHSVRFLLAMCLVVVTLAGCSGGDLPAAPTAAPTATTEPVNPPPTKTARPTSAPRNTATRPKPTQPPPTATEEILDTPTPEPTIEEATETPEEATEEPTVEGTETPSDEPTAITKDFDFLDQSDYTDSLGDAVVVGLIKYLGDVPIGSVEIAVELEDADHKLLATESASIVPSLVKPGGLIPFKATFSNPPSDYEYYNTTVQGDEVDQSILDLYTDDFEVVQSNIVQGSDPSTPRLVGKVKNTGSDNANDTEVIAALLDSTGEVLDVDSAYTTLSSISPGDQSAFEIHFENGDEGSDFEIVVTGDKP